MGCDALCFDPIPQKEATVRLHAPSMWWFIASLIIAIIAIFSALTPIPYFTAYGVWVAILAYIVLAVSNLAQT
jgi:hypothetical protein